MIWVLGLSSPSVAQVSTDAADILRAGQRDLAQEGRAFLEAEAANAHLFLLGELHGDNEVPGLLRALWPTLWRGGYRHLAAEVSPWAAHHLQERRPAVHLGGLWRPQDAAFVAAQRQAGDDPVLWGCDMEEGRPDALLAALAAANPANVALRNAVARTRTGYRREMAPDLLQAVGAAAPVDVVVGGHSLLGSVIDTLSLEILRLGPIGSPPRTGVRRS